MPAAEVKTVLVLPGADLDQPPWMWFGNVVTNIRDHIERWNAPLLDPESDLAVVLALPSRYASSKRIQEAWDHEKEMLEDLFCEFGHHLKGDRIHLYDLTLKNQAEERLREVFIKYQQVVGIGHVEFEVPRCKCCGQPLRQRGTPFFEIGDCRLGPKFLQSLGTKLRNQKRDLQQRRAIFLGCSTRYTELPKQFIAAGLSTVFLATRRVVNMNDMLSLLMGFVMNGYARAPAKCMLDAIWSAHTKILGFQRMAIQVKQGRCLAGVEPVLILPANIADSRASYFFAEACPQEGLPHLSPVSRDELYERTGDLGAKAELLLVDAPKELREELREYVRRHAPDTSIVWVGAGSSCGRVSEAIFRNDVQYHLAYVRTPSSHVVHRLVRDYVCMSVDDASSEMIEKEMMSFAPHGLEPTELKRLLTQLAREHSVVVG